MEEKMICQSCGMIMNDNDYGTNKDYCKYCFQNGKFTKECDMEEMIESNLNYLDEFNKEANTNFNKDQARVEMKKFFPSLKRWK